MLRALPLLLVLALGLFCLIDVIGSRSETVRNLPKLGWLLIVGFFPLIGSLAWLVAGRPRSSRGQRSRFERPTPGFPEYDRPGRAAGATPESDEEFLRKIRERAEDQRRRAAERRAEEERKAQEGKDPDAER